MGIAKLRDLTGGEDSKIALEAGGHMPAYEQAFGTSTGPSTSTGVPDGYRATTDREALKELVRP